jgi:hypothetical protein
MLFHKKTALVASFADKEGSWQNKVCLTPEGKSYASNSFILGKITPKHDKPDESEFPKVGDFSPEAITEPITVNAVDLKHFVGRIKKNESLPICESFAASDGNLISTNLESGITLSIGNQEEKYPLEKIDEVVRNCHPTKSVNLNAKYLKTIADFFVKFLSDDNLKPVTLEIESEDKAVVFRAETTDHEALAIVMPIRK